ncbi:hypothetical protein BLNAU_15818 [Blattamonas nauphoetae]|uniref:Uncharacterized protein n=1 Tax=Blattamonas nauphoetae TaxID=2049346 RepID=A0ABQ9XDB9_9EUKA|nr:hypothetical protein BLNAU_15818 [Blattamonas nauphoetae]
MLFQSHLSKVEHEDSKWSILGDLSLKSRMEGADGAVRLYRWRLLMQTLEREGLIDGLEQTLLHDDSSEDGHDVRIFSSEIMITLGMNSPLPEIDDE